MVNNKTPPYLNELVPSYVGDQVNFVTLRNQNKLRSLKCRTTKYKRSFLPNVVNLWNNLDDNDINVESLSIFKNRLQQDVRVNSLFLHGSRKLSLIHSQLRMHCSNLNSHLYSLHVLDQPNCVCGFRDEDVKHYFIFCPLYNHLRGPLIEFFEVNNIAMNVQHILYGIDDTELEINIELFDIIHNFIDQSKRFS